MYLLFFKIEFVGVQKQRQFTLHHGGLLQSEDLFGQRDEMKYDPLQQLLKFMGDRGSKI